MWVVAIYRYGEIYQQVKPKREKVIVMQKKLESDMEKLAEQQKQLQEVD